MGNKVTGLGDGLIDAQHSELIGPFAFTMSEYWVSKKKYLCKYCDIFIADDAPSRQHHENGLRHKGNVERFIRGIYKTGEKQKKDLEEEKREMRRVEQVRILDEILHL